MYSVRRIAGKLAHLYYINRSAHRKTKGKILMMHSIADEKEEFTITPSDFESLLQYLSDKNVIRLENWEKENDFYALTFDDVKESFYKNGFPLLKRYNLPFTIFVNTSLLDTEGFITTAQLREFAACELCIIGSHGVSHEQYHGFSRQQAQEDLMQSCKSLEMHIGKPVDLFAFPYGSYSACGFKNKNLAGKVYKYAFGTVRCAITEPPVLPNYFLPRINVDSNYIQELTRQ